MGLLVGMVLVSDRRLLMGGAAVNPCAAGLHGVQQDPSVRRTSFAACILDFKIPELGI